MPKVKKPKYLSVEVHDSFIEEKNDFLSLQTAITACKGAKIIFVVSFNPNKIFSRWAVSTQKRETSGSPTKIVSRVLHVQMLGFTLIVELLGVSKRRKNNG